MHMAQYITPEQRAKILSAIKDEGMSLPDAAKTFLVAESTLRKWVRKQTRNGHTSSTEVQRLKQENQELKAIIGEMILHQKMKKKSSFLGS
jgi:transposase-like protein